jgi:hypothetical protein
MTDMWYYWHDGEVLGPFTAERLADLALAERILSTDIVWRADIEAGVPADRVKHLFPPLAATPAGAELTPGVQAASPSAEVADRTNSPRWDSASSASQTTRRAVAGKGTVIVGQDGTTVKYRMQCTTCGQQDSSYKSALISRGTTRVSFFCPKCRKSCAAEIHGHIS